MKEYKVGQIVTINGMKTRVIEEDSCRGCIFVDTTGSGCKDNNGIYACFDRSDHKKVIFKPIASTPKAANNQSDAITPKQGNSSLDANKTSEFPLPPENLRVWIRGNKERGEEVIKALTDLGAKNNFKHHGWNEDAIFFIDKNNEVDSTAKENTLAEFIVNFYKETKLPWRPKDKELAWCWDNEDEYCRELKFYDVEHDSTFTTTLGKRLGEAFDNYAPYEGEWPQWAKDAQKKLKD